MKAYKTVTIHSPANIAFIKYWGQRDPELVLPFNDSFSMNMSACTTELVIEFFTDSSIQQMEIKEFQKDQYRPSTEKELQKVQTFYPVAKKFLNAESNFGFSIRSSNSFPLKAGIASSASFFSALAYAFMIGFEKQLPEDQLSVLARLTGSGSAARSIPDGFVWWNARTSSETSYAYSLGKPEDWDIVDIVLVLNTQEKKVSSQAGHRDAPSSPYFQSRQEQLITVTAAMKKAFESRDFTQFGTLLEQEAIHFHSILMTQTPPLFYWSGKTLDVFRDVVDLRAAGVECYATTDAGENVHIIAKESMVDQIVSFFNKKAEIETIIINKPAPGTRQIS